MIMLRTHQSKVHGRNSVQHQEGDSEMNQFHFCFYNKNLVVCAFRYLMEWTGTPIFYTEK